MLLETQLILIRVQKRLLWWGRERAVTLNVGTKEDLGVMGMSEALMKTDLRFTG